MKHLIFSLFVLLTLNGCFVGTVASMPFKAAGAILPGAAGTAASVAGSAVDTVIPF